MTAYEIIAWLGRHAERTAHLCLDSRQVQPGDVFFACQGSQTDGREYIDDALANGAVAVLVEAGDGKPDLAVPCAEVRGLTDVLGQVGHHWYREPSHTLSVVAVTGTNGKTTCVNWIATALNGEGVSCGTVGTLGVVLPDGRNLGGALTTPDVLTMHRSLAALRDAGAAVAAIEASSIGIEQGRLDHVKIEIAAFTNLTHDHLDYHGTLERYQAAKFKLFRWPRLSAAVINIDDPVGAELMSATTVSNPVSYSMQPDAQAHVQAQDVQSSGYGLVFNLLTARGSAQVLTRMVGLHNVSNLLLVAAVLGQLGWGMARTVRALAALQAVDGRLQVVDALECGDSRSLPMVVVDYAHTPDALERALGALVETANARGGRLVCVFGCGGSRDTKKRPLMGGLAAKLADHVILTNDNPRNEDPEDIVAQIAAGMPATPHVILDRAQAILTAIWGADEKDVVLLAGKGHETWQEFDTGKAPFDDREWARLALTWLRGVRLSTDTRTIAAGDLFVALSGENFDGHDYLATAAGKGACGAIVGERQASVPLPQLVVGDTRQALAQVAAVWRSYMKLPVIGVTGSNGKTTTKEMIAAILRAWQGPDAVLATQGNLNNDLGVPLTVLRLNKTHQAAVIEMGMNHPGEIGLLAKIAQPTVALINNAQREHQEFMHTVDAVARENGAVLDALPADGVAVFPGDDSYTGLWTGMAAGRTLLKFGFNPEFDVYADQIHAQPTETGFELHTPVGSGPVMLQAQGLHNLRNALAAATCAVALNIPFISIVRGLQAFNPVAGRMKARVIADGMQIIDDTYNANPDSVRAAIDVLASLQGTKVLVLGDMGEVGEDASEDVHAEVGSYAYECGINVLLALGPASAHAAESFGPTAIAFDDLQELNTHLTTLLPANVLVKGSRSARMERVLDALSEHLAGQTEGKHSAT